MGRMEIRPGEGGADAAAFAQELAHGVSKYTGRPVSTVGTAFVLHRL